MKVVAFSLLLLGCNTDTRNYLMPSFEYQHGGMTKAQHFQQLHEQMRLSGDTNWDLPFPEEK
jgi:hypothetical protein